MLAVTCLLNDTEKLLMKYRYIFLPDHKGKAEIAFGVVPYIIDSGIGGRGDGGAPASGRRGGGICSDGILHTAADCFARDGYKRLFRRIIAAVVCSHGSSCRGCLFSASHLRFRNNLNNRLL